MSKVEHNTQFFLDFKQCQGDYMYQKVCIQGHMHVFTFTEKNTKLMKSAHDP